MLQKINLYSSIASVYLLTIGVIAIVLYSSHTFGTPVWAISKPSPTYRKPAKPVIVVPDTISGEPIRLVIPARNIDLQIDEGRYDEASKTWTLSPTHAEFATSTMPANDQGGATFIYGHGTYPVLGKIGTSHPPAGSIAEIHTDNKHVFTYTLQSVHNLNPTDTSILRDVATGPPRLIVQTCTGAFSEWRTEFIFSFQKVQ